MPVPRIKAVALSAIVGSALLVAVITFGVLSLGVEKPAETIAAGRAVYQQHCASCHGVNLEGQPDWKTPLPSGRLPASPHDESGHTWHHSDRVLFEITKYGTAAVVGGGYESDMRGFQDTLSDDEIRAVLSFIKSTWPQRERRYQEDATRRAIKSGFADKRTDLGMSR